MKLNLLICDDEEISLGVNESYIRRLNQQLKIEANLFSFCNVTEELDRRIQKGDIDIAFLDIELKEGNGIQLAQKILAANPLASFIFITGYKEYTAEAFQVQASGYLEKPIQLEQLKRTYERTLAMVEGFRKHKESAMLTIKTGTKMIHMRYCDIHYVEKVAKKVAVHSNYGVYEFYESISVMEQQLGRSFLKINQGTLVNKAEIVCLDKTSVYLKTGKILRVGRTFKHDIKSIYSNVICQ
ncbi:LytR/AlgR family response regulator transcription factor [Anaeromicropila populeti]|nr:LytTR family DNA-binding domain-containing protein [Anaeromicropila populeti]